MICALLTGCRTNDPWEQADQILASITEPNIKNITLPDGEKEVEADYSIEEFGAIGDGTTLNTEAINKAIIECSEQGGGTVLIPAGTFLTGAIHLKSGVRLHLADEAILSFSTNPQDYLPIVLTRWEGINCYNYSPLIYAIDAHDIAITGNGLLQGNGNQTNWWPWSGGKRHGWVEGIPSQHLPHARPMLTTYNKEKTPIEERIMGEGFYLRPQFINFMRCTNVLIADLRIENSPFWIIHPVICENVIVRKVSVTSLGPNNDGCDPESCKNVLIEGCMFNTGDDCIAIKSGRDNDGRASDNRPSENIIIRNCQMKNGHGGVVIGSEASGGAKNIFVENCTMDSPMLDRAIRLKSNSNRGGIIENVYVRNVTVGEVSESVLHINLLYDIKREGSDTLYPIVRNVHLDNVTSQKSRYGIFIDGIEGQNCISNIELKKCNFMGVEEGNIIRNSEDVSIIE